MEQTNSPMNGMPSCEFEHDVILSLHRELPISRRILTWFHMLKCPTCRQLHRQVAQVSEHMRSHYANSNMSVVHMKSPQAVRRGQVMVVVLAGIIALAVASTAYQANERYGSPEFTAAKKDSDQNGDMKKKRLKRKAGMILKCLD